MARDGRASVSVFFMYYERKEGVLEEVWEGGGGIR